MRVVVDRELCGAHGMCEREAPAVFRVVETADGYAGVELLNERPSGDHVRTAVSPNQALSLIED